MTLAITIIREASLRIPGSVGYFVGTLAAIIIGQAAVTAGYVSASLIIVVAISAIASFAISSTMLVYPARMLSYFFIILSSLFGMFGLINGVVIVVWHLVSQESFGVPYLYPLVPFDINGIKDTFIRAPFTELKKRLRILSPFNRNRMPDNKKQNNE
jgi:spore germination protein KA